MRNLTRSLVVIAFLAAAAPANAQDSMYDAVFTLHLVNKQTKTVSTPRCLGVLVSPNHLLTAAHCVTIVKLQNKKPVVKKVPANRVVAALALDAGDYQGALRSASSIMVHPRYNPLNRHNDLALIRLKKPISPDIAVPVPLLPADQGFTVSDIGTRMFVYGLSRGGVPGGVGGSYADLVSVDGPGCGGDLCPVQGDPSTQVFYTNGYLGSACTEASEGPVFVPGKRGFTASDPDDPDASWNMNAVCINPEFSDGPYLPASGGPAFYAVNGKVYLAGISTYVEVGVLGVCTRTDVFDSFIE